MAPAGTKERSAKADVQAAIDAFEESVRLSNALNATLKINTRRIFRDHGFTKVIEEVEHLDNDKIRDRVYEVIEENIVVTDDDYEGRMHRETLTGMLLSDLPVKDSGEEWDALDAETRAAWNSAHTDIWQAIQMAPGSALQRRVSNRGDGLMLVKTDHHVYITGEARFIRRDVFIPRTDKYQLLAGALGEELGKFSKQVPGLKKVAKATLTTATKKAGEKAQAAFTLRSGNSGDDNDNNNDE